MSTVDWTGDLSKNLKQFSPRVRAALTAIVGFEAPRTESYMKTNATWIDRTGNARSGLTARPYANVAAFGIRISHGVPYGVWLEVRFGGRYSIINTTLQARGPEVMATASALFGRL